MLTCQEIAEKCDVKVITVYRWIRAGKLKAFHKLGKKGYFVKECDFEAFKNSTEVEVQ